MRYTIKKWGVLNVVPGSKGGLDVNVTGFEFEGDLAEGFKPELAMQAIVSRLQDEIKTTISKDYFVIEDMEIIK